MIVNVGGNGTGDLAAKPNTTTSPPPNKIAEPAHHPLNHREDPPAGEKETASDEAAVARIAPGAIAAGLAVPAATAM